MDIKGNLLKPGFDKINVAVGAFVFLFTFIIFRITVAPTLSFWDCGEFIACSYILGIPHPPGSPLFILIGRFFSVLPIASDICFRINFISVISSAITTLFGYLILVRVIKTWYQDQEFSGWKKAITFIGSATGAFFMAFSSTNWGNSVEAEVYSISMLIMALMFWLTLKFYDFRGTPKASRIIILVSYLAMLGVCVHLTTYLIMPISAIYFILKKDAPARAWWLLCGFFFAELVAIMLTADGRGGYPAFIAITVILLAVVAIMTYKHINWPVLFGIGAMSMIMVGFYQFFYGLIGATILMLVIAYYARQSDWKTGLMILLIAAAGFSVYAFVPIRSTQDPRIDENNTKRSFSIFVDFVDRKQYGRESMVERMFHRRGTWAHQFGRHNNMGFWSYFEEQYSSPKVFPLLLLLGLFGIYYAIQKKMEIGLPFFTFLLLASVGLILYMNFADGIKYDPVTGDAYQEVRNRDYFFTPFFMYFGLVLGLGVAGLMETVRVKTMEVKWSKFQKPALVVLSLLALTPTMALSDNYFPNDRSRNYYPYWYAYDLLNNCRPNSILFTSGDNDTFPLWCVQEVYKMRTDVNVVNLSLFNTDWYVAQMKEQGVPISLNYDQIYWENYDYDGQIIQRPKDPFYDRARKRRTYLVPMPFEGRIVKLQDMMVDDVVLTNNWQRPIYFTSDPYAESPLKLRDLTVSDGIVYRLEKEPPARRIDLDDSYKMFTQVFHYDGLNDYGIYRDENASGVMLAFGFNALRVADELQRTDQAEKARDFLRFIIDKYPEFFQSYSTLAQMYKKAGDTAAADDVLKEMVKNLSELHRVNPSNLFYTQDLGLAKYYTGDVEGGLALLWEAFDADPNSGYAYRKLVQVLYETKRTSEIMKATQMFADYKINRKDPLVQQLLGPTESIPSGSDAGQ
ncbi:conserved membrane hypothetical protein [Candidatus Zixiibacteriota bacterium]|nr:conserved membrane hypothetical protein [candidate division Zixibacteria bacterium]